MLAISVEIDMLVIRLLCNYRLPNMYTICDFINFINRRGSGLLDQEGKKGSAFVII